MNERELLALKKEIETSKTKASELKGQQSYIMKDLLDRFGCKTIKEAEKMAAKLKTDIDKGNEKIALLLEKIGERYDAITRS